MKQTLIFLLLAIPLFCMAQNALPRIYDYDAAGNRVLRKVLEIFQTPPAPTDSLQFTNDDLRFTSEEPFFVETMNRVEIKIYPNPTAEKFTLEISQWESLQTGVFKLYSLTGQLLQDHPVHAAHTTISLANLPKGAYILNVHINGRMEEWKVIKN